MRRAITVLAMLLAFGSSGCTATVRATLACEHCYCSWSPRDVRHPVSCSSLDYELTCCFADSS